MMTKSYAQIKAAIAKLEKEAATLRANEAAKAVTRIRESIAIYGLTAEQIFGQATKVKSITGKVVSSSGKAKRKGAGVAKYRDPKTGKTWTGFGKAPGWIAKARNRDRFLIGQPGAGVTDPVANPAAPEVATSNVKMLAASAPAKKAQRPRKLAASVGITSAQAPAKKRASTRTATKKIASAKELGPATKVASAAKRAKAGNAVAKTSKKTIVKDLASRPSAKRGARANPMVSPKEPSTNASISETMVSGS